MPWPHTNADGKATKGFDADGHKKKPESVEFPVNYYASNPYGKTTAQLDNLLKEVYNSKVLGDFSCVDIQGYSKGDMQAVQKLYNSGVMSKEQAAKTFGINYQPNPILIPATEKPHYATSYWVAPASGPVKSMPQPQQFRMDMRIDMPGLKYGSQKMGYAQVLDSTKDYTEDDIRFMMDRAFAQYKDKVIEELKKGLK